MSNDFWRVELLDMFRTPLKFWCLSLFSRLKLLQYLVTCHYAPSWNKPVGDIPDDSQAFSAWRSWGIQGMWPIKPGFEPANSRYPAINSTYTYHHIPMENQHVYTIGTLPCSVKTSDFCGCKDWQLSNLQGNHPFSGGHQVPVCSFL